MAWREWTGNRAGGDRNKDVKIFFENDEDGLVQKAELEKTKERFLKVEKEDVQLAGATV